MALFIPALWVSGTASLVFRRKQGRLDTMDHILRDPAPPTWPWRLSGFFKDAGLWRVIGSGGGVCARGVALAVLQSWFESDPGKLLLTRRT